MGRVEKSGPSSVTTRVLGSFRPHPSPGATSAGEGVPEIKLAPVSPGAEGEAVGGRHLPDGPHQDGTNRVTVGSVEVVSPPKTVLHPYRPVRPPHRTRVVCASPCSGTVCGAGFPSRLPLSSASVSLWRPAHQSSVRTESEHGSGGETELQDTDVGVVLRGTRPGRVNGTGRDYPDDYRGDTPQLSSENP